MSTDHGGFCGPQVRAWVSAVIQGEPQKGLEQRGTDLSWVFTGPLWLHVEHGLQGTRRQGSLV